MSPRQMDEETAEGWGCLAFWVGLGVAIALSLASGPIIDIIKAVQGR